MPFGPEPGRGCPARSRMLLDAVFPYSTGRSTSRLLPMVPVNPGQSVSISVSSLAVANDSDMRRISGRYYDTTYVSSARPNVGYA